jgi:hypothetical protein
MESTIPQDIQEFLNEADIDMTQNPIVQNEEDLDPEGEELHEEAGKVFIFTSTQVHLTYKSHIEPMALLHYIDKIVRGSGEKNRYGENCDGIWKFSIVNETSDTVNPYDHTHAYFLFKGRFTSTGSRLFDYMPKDATEPIHPNIKLPRHDVARMSTKMTKGTGAYIACIYHRKQPTAPRITNYPNASTPVHEMQEEIVAAPDGTQTKKQVPVLKGYLPTLPDFETCNDTMDSLLLCLQAPGADLNMSGKMQISIDLARNTQPVNTMRTLVDDELYPWQRRQCSIIELDDTDRTVMWNSGGGDDGKTQYAFHLMAKYNALRLTRGSARDLKYAILMHTQRYGYPKIIVLDFAKSVVTSDRYIKTIEKKVFYDDGNKYCKVMIDKAYANPEMVELMEMIRDGAFTSEKYIPANVMFPVSPIVIVFSNFRPEPRFLSVDRWLISSTDFTRDVDVYICGSSGKRVLQRYASSLELLDDMDAGKLVMEKVMHVKDGNQAMAALETSDINIRMFFWERGLKPIFRIEDCKEYGTNLTGDQKLLQEQIVHIRTVPFTDEDHELFRIKFCERPAKPEPLFEGVSIACIKEAIRMSKVYTSTYKVSQRTPVVLRYIEACKARGEIVSYE